MPVVGESIDRKRRRYRSADTDGRAGIFQVSFPLPVCALRQSSSLRRPSCSPFSYSLIRLLYRVPFSPQIFRMHLVGRPSALEHFFHHSIDEANWSVASNKKFTRSPPYRTLVHLHSVVLILLLFAWWRGPKKKRCGSVSTPFSRRCNMAGVHVMSFNSRYDI